MTVGGALEVLDRTWAWDSTYFSFAHGAGGDCGYATFYASDSTALGRNLRADSTCTPRLYDPDVIAYPDSAYEVAEVTDGGPNDGLWYITQASYRMDRGSHFNPFVTPQGRVDTLSFNKDVNACSKAGLTNIVNCHDFNDHCQNFSLAPFWNGLRGHEGMGTPTGTLNGHESRNREAALDPANDPFLGVEILVNPDSAALNTVVQTEVFFRDQAAFLFGQDHTFVRDNYVQGNKCGKIWRYDKPIKYVFVELKQAIAPNVAACM